MLPAFVESAARVTTYFQRLGRRIQEEWLPVHYDPRQLPAVAERALRDDVPHASIQPHDVSNWFLATAARPSQPNADFNFGQPPIAVYYHDHFYIEVLVWLDGTTDIHQHSFDGAFCVLGGSSVHSTYRFHECARTSERVLLGDVEHVHSELLRPGDVRAIVSGSSFIHSLFHLDRPSMSVVVRNRTTFSSGIQYRYFPPYLAFAPAEVRFFNKRILDYIEVVHAEKRRDAPDFVRAAISRADDCGALGILSALVAEAHAGDLAAAMRAAAAEACMEKFGPFGTPILKSIEALQPQLQLVRLRSRVVDPEHRRFLALLMNVPRRQRIVDLVRGLTPDRDPYEQTLAWLRALTSTGSALAGYAIGDDALTLADGLIRGLSLPELIHLLEKKHDTSLNGEQQAEVENAVAGLMKIDILKPLMVDAEVPLAREVLSIGA